MKLFLFIIFLISIVCQANAKASDVNVQINDKTYQYVDSPRLTNVLEPVAFEKQWYWSNAKLFNLDSGEINALRDRLIVSLDNIQASSGNITNAYSQLAQQVKSWKLAHRINIRIDYDLARYTLKNNPIFEAGNYLITLSERPKHIKIFGAVSKPLSKDYQNNTCVHDVLKNVKLSDEADKSIVYLIESSGVVQKAPIAYWNKNCVIAKPGSMVYVPLEEDQIFKQNSELNLAIVHLAKNRID